MSNDWIDAEGFRANVGIILTDSDGKLLLAGRAGSKGWQFPQGGVLVDEEPEEAMFRELREEVGLGRDDVEMLGVTDDWLRYRLPDKFVRRHSKPLCIGQKQRWFMLRPVPHRPTMSVSIWASNRSLIASAGWISGAL